MTRRIGHEPIRMRRLPDITDETGEEPYVAELGDFRWDLRHGRRVLHVALPYPERWAKGAGSMVILEHRPQEPERSPVVMGRK